MGMVCKMLKASTPLTTHSRKNGFFIAPIAQLEEALVLGTNYVRVRIPLVAHGSVIQLEEMIDLKSIKYGFESHQSYNIEGTMHGA